MEWLHDLGKQTRRGLAHGSRAVGGVLDHVGSAVDTVASATEVLLPTGQSDVLSEVGEAEPTSEARGGHAERRPAQRAASRRDGPADPALCTRAPCVVPTCSLEEPAAAHPGSRRARAARGSERIPPRRGAAGVRRGG